MENVSGAALDRGLARHTIEVADSSLTFRPVAIHDLTPNGAALAAAAGFAPDRQATVLHILADGELEDIRPDEMVDLRHGEGRFVIVESDRSYRFTHGLRALRLAKPNRVRRYHSQARPRTRRPRDFFEGGGRP
jgi:Multiubiquitin